MSGSPSSSSRWTLTAEAFNTLLAALDPDRERAGERYELLRRKLVRVFEWRGASDAEGWTDETLNRVARRLEAGESVRDVASYAAGVARMVAREAQRAAVRAGDELDERMPAPHGAEDDAPERFACLDRCLDALPPGQRDLVMEYFADERRVRIDHRRALAERLGVEMNALRIRVHRIRARLELCVKECVNGEGRE